MQRRKQKQPTDASDRNKTDPETISTKLGCSKTASTMCAGWAISQASGTSPWPPAPGEREDGLLVLLAELLGGFGRHILVLYSAH